MSLLPIAISEEEIAGFCKRNHIRRLALFGSALRDDFRADSDIDILIELKEHGQRPPLGLKWFGLEADLSRLLNREVELVSARALSPYIRPYVEKEMVVIYEEGSCPR